MAMTWEQLQKLSDEELIKEYDRTAGNTSIGLNYFRDEIARREQDKQTQMMLNYTKQLWILTIIVTVATIISLVISLVALFR